MKKVLTVLVVAMIALNSVFAVVDPTSQVVNAQTKPETSAEVKVGLTVDPTQMKAYAFGFSKVNNKNNLEKQDFTLALTGYDYGDGSELALELDPVSFLATNTSSPLYFYYKIQESELITLKLSMSGKLTDEHLTADPLDWTVTSVGANANDNFTEAGGNLTIALDSNGSSSTDIKLNPGADGVKFMYGACKLNIATTTAVPILSQTAHYQGTLILQITTNA